MNATKEAVLLELHELVGLCSHCGKRSCAGRNSQSFLPERIPYGDIIDAIDKAVTREPGIIADLEAQLAAALKDLAEIRAVHRQMVAGLGELEKKLIEDTVG